MLKLYHQDFVSHSLDLVVWLCPCLVSSSGKFFSPVPASNPLQSSRDSLQAKLLPHRISTTFLNPVVHLEPMPILGVRGWSIQIDQNGA